MTGLPQIDGGRLLRRLDEFAKIGATLDGGVNRQALTELDRQARACLAKIATDRGFSVFQDAAANMFIRRRGEGSDRPPLLIGSHLDTQPTGGRFDGALGTLAAFEVLEAIDDVDYATEMPIEVVVWTNEEGCRFSPGSMGSRAFAEGGLDPGLLDNVADDGARLGDELEATLAALPSAGMRPLGGALAGYLELHIEQGPILERENTPIGIVTGIQGTRWLRVRITGEAGHAGTTPLSARHDPMMAASDGLSALYARIMPGDDEARLTVGRMTVEPGSINAIPSSVIFSIDIRHPDVARLDAVDAEIRERLEKACAEYGCGVVIDRIFDLPPTEFADSLIDCIEGAALAHGVSARRIVSGAFHDALFVARVAPAAMIFVPCRDGVSHNAREYVEPGLSVLGAEILLHASLGAPAALGLNGTPKAGKGGAVAMAS